MRFEVWKLGCIEVWWLGGIYSPNHQSSRLVKAAVAWRTGQSSAPPDTVRCASHVTRPLGFDRWSFWQVGHRTVRWCTGQSLCTVRCAFWRLLWLCARRRALFTVPIAVADDRWRGLAVTPLAHRTVRWIIAEWLLEFPKLSSLELDSLVHRTLSGGTPDSPVRQTRAAFGCLAPFFLNPFFWFCIGLCWTFGTCRTYNLEQTS
jgi:hypothetical protein